MVKEISDKARQAIEEAVAYYPAGWKHDICALQIINRESGRHEREGKNGYICHAPIINCNADKAIVVNAHKFQWHQQNPEFIRWVTGGSPFTHGVLNRDNERELFDHASVIDVNEVGKGGALWLCKALRYFEEDTWKPDVWNKLRDAGLDGLQAFIGASILNVEGQPMQYSHVNLFGYQNPEGLRKTYDTIRNKRKIEDMDAAMGMYEKYKNWGELRHTIERKGDGWGGYVEVKKPSSAKEYAAKLKEIFEGDPSNVG